MFALFVTTFKDFLTELHNEICFRKRLLSQILLTMHFTIKLKGISHSVWNLNLVRRTRQAVHFVQEFVGNMYKCRSISSCGHLSELMCFSYDRLNFSLSF